MNTNNLNHYETIASLFAEAEPEAPQSISADSIEQKILLGQRHRRIKFEQKTNLKPLIAAIACFAVILSVLSFFNPFHDNTSKAQSFKNEQELNSFVSELKSGSSSELGAGTALFPQSINTVNDLKNKRNCLAANDKYIFYAYYDYNSDTNRNKIYIFTAEKENSKLIHVFDKFTEDCNEVSSAAVYENNLAVTIVNERHISTTTKIYDVSDPETPVLKAEFEQSGGSASTYFINNTLYIATYYGTAHDDINGYSPKSESLAIKPENIYRFDSPEYIEYIVIGAINIKTCKRAQDTKAVLGANYERSYFDACLYLTNGDYDNPKYMKYDLKTGKAESTTLIAFHTKSYDIFETPYLIQTEDNRLISIMSVENGIEIILYDITNEGEPAVLDSKILNGLYGNYHQLTSADNHYFFTYYKADAQRRYYGAVELKIENDEIITAEHTAADENIMQDNTCIAVGDSIYTIYQPAADTAEIYSFQYR